MCVFVNTITYLISFLVPSEGGSRNCMQLSDSAVKINRSAPRLIFGEIIICEKNRCLAQSTISFDAFTYVRRCTSFSASMQTSSLLFFCTAILCACVLCVLGNMCIHGLVSRVRHIQILYALCSVYCTASQTYIRRKSTMYTVISNYFDAVQNEMHPRAHIFASSSSSLK